MKRSLMASKLRCSAFIPSLSAQSVGFALHRACTWDLSGAER